ncbi:MAG: hypothetical protein ACK41P_08870, partial [Asticcacaulis sp.]
GVVMALPQGNSLLVADYVDNLRRIRGLVSQIELDKVVRAAADKRAKSGVPIEDGASLRPATEVHAYADDEDDDHGRTSALPDANSLFGRGSLADVDHSDED